MAVHTAHKRRIYSLMISRRKLRFYFYAFAILIYGVWGHPFPKGFGPAELASGFFLALAAGVSGAIHLLGRPHRQFRIPWAVFAYLVTVPFVVGMFHGWDINDVVRDVIPLLFFFQFLVFLPEFSPWAAESLPWLLTLSGLILAARFYKDLGGSMFKLGQELYKWNFSVYIPYDPAILFGAIFLWLRFFAHPHWKRTPLLAGSLFLISTEAAINQRAPVVLFVLVVLVHFLWTSSVRSKVWGILILSGIWLLGREQLQGIALAIAHKTVQQQIFSGKVQEFLMILDHIQTSPVHLLFGFGWGALFVSPYGSIPISFTHLFLSYFLLKTGLIGMMLLISFAYWAIAKVILAWKTRRLSGNALIIVISCSVPLFTYATFQPSYKVFTYGVILLLLIAVIQKESRRYPDYGDANNEPDSDSANL